MPFVIHTQAMRCGLVCQWLLFWVTRCQHGSVRVWLPLLDWLTNWYARRSDAICIHVLGDAFAWRVWRSRLLVGYKSLTLAKNQINYRITKAGCELVWYEVVCSKFWDWIEKSMGAILEWIVAWEYLYMITKLVY
jgi:hypothetical protein